MKFFTGLIFVIYFIVYGYSVHMTSVEPNRNIWGYICTLIFTIIVPWGISIFIKYQNKKPNNENNQDNL